MRVVVKIGGSLIKEAPELVDRLIKEFGSGNPKIAGDKEQTSGRLPLFHPHCTRRRNIC